ncbi:hypothetical protein [Nocardioides gilvus]|uniref:hypothetical protein n=1 Tax=Nocardioides gilvus TaxID=1735589 RepID=UPI000D746588|nr:hypothetical protein [Nocardioides gilvus]
MSSPTPSRRGLIAASAWTVPAVVLASSAPAFAGSGKVCGPLTYGVTWKSPNYAFTPNSAGVPNGAGQGRVVANPLGGVVPANLARDREALLVTVTNKLNGGRVRGASASDGAANMRVSPFGVGGLGVSGLTVMQDFASNVALPTPRSAHGQTLTLQFSRPVKNLRFTITDIDSSSGQYRDRVWVSQPPNAVRAASGIRGTGTQGDPWRQRYNTSSFDPDSEGGGNVTLTYGDTAMSTLQIHFWNDQPNALSGNGLQGIFLSSLEFTASTC